MSATLCPECQQGKPQNCTGEALAPDGSTMVQCPGLKPETPYAGTSGHSGTETSQGRAYREDTDGTTGRRQRKVLRLAATMSMTGLTVKDVRDLTGWHHGQASSVLSGLHKTGHLSRLAEVRDRCKVYVLPNNVAGRVTEEYLERKPALTGVEKDIDTVARMLFADARNYIGWGDDAPDVGESDWRAIERRIKQLGEEMSPAQDEYHAAYARLEQRSKDSE